MNDTSKGKIGHIFSRYWFEPLLLFGVLYLPGYLSQTTEFNRNLFDSLSFNLLYIIITIPQVLFILYLVWKKEPEAMDTYGIQKITPRDIPWSLAVMACIFVVVVPFMVLLRFILPAGEPLLQEPGWRISRPGLLPVILITCLATGYSEELFFRSYLLTTLQNAGIGPVSAVAATVLLFSAGHLYQGFESFLGTALIGVVLSIFFLRHRNLHRIGIAHGLYNFLVLFFSLFLPAPG